MHILSICCIYSSIHKESINESNIIDDTSVTIVDGDFTSSPSNPTTLPNTEIKEVSRYLCSRDEIGIIY